MHLRLVEMKRLIAKNARGYAIFAATLLVMLLALTVWRGESALAVAANGTIPPVRPELANGSMECANGYVATSNSLGETIYLPQQWHLALETGGPLIHSARIFFEQRQDSSGGCDTDRAHVERIEGRDSMVVRARDLETPPVPGKPYDVVLYQRVPVVPGGDYSLSGWMLSLCGGSAVPSDCPADKYIVKALGLDPAGGVNTLSGNVAWTEDRRNFVDENDERVGWSNLRMAARARGEAMTVYARLQSPFQHHGNHGFIDALSLVRAPVAWLQDLPEEVHYRRDLKLVWQSLRSPDIEGIPDGTYEYFVDVQVRALPGSEWRDVAVGLPEESSSMLYCAAETNTTYEFRVRARAEQPPAPPDGAWPNQRYPGVWSEPQAVRFVQDSSPPPLPAGDARLFLPSLTFNDPCP